MTAALPPGLTVRAPTEADAEAIAALINSCKLAEQGTPSLAADEVHLVWQTVGFTLATDAWVVITPEGKLVAYGDLLPRGDALFYSGGWVHPDYLGKGIGTSLLRLLETRARQHLPVSPEAHISIKATSISSNNVAAHQLMQQEGYRLAQHFWEMRIELDTEPPAPDWPDGITLRPFIPNRDLLPVASAVEEAFQDHRNHTPLPPEEWEQRVKRADFDSTLWLIAVAGREIAGAALCRYQSATAWVGRLAVRRPWRRQGLGMALLRQAFAEFYRRGDRRVVLTVDAQNPTGAVHLYEQAGMHIAWQYNTYEKEVRG